MQLCTTKFQREQVQTSYAVYVACSFVVEVVEEHTQLSACHNTCSRAVSRLSVHCRGYLTLLHLNTGPYCTVLSHDLLEMLLRSGGVKCVLYIHCQHCDSALDILQLML